MAEFRSPLKDKPLRNPGQPVRRTRLDIVFDRPMAALHSGLESAQPYQREHPRDIGAKLKLLVERGWLGKHGHGRGTRYRSPQLGAPDLFGGTLTMEPAEHVLDDSPPKALNSQHKDASFQHKDANSPDYEPLRALAAPIRERLRAKPADVRATILGLCSGAYLSLRELAELLGRQPASVQNHYLTPMLKEGVLVQRYPGNPNHPNQGYRKAEK